MLLDALVVGVLVGLAAQAAPPGRGVPAPDPEKDPPSPPASPSPSPSPMPSPGSSSRPPLRLNVDRHVESHLQQEGQAGLPHFKESVEVDDESPQTMLERHYEGLHLDCGGLEGGAPTEAEMRAVRPHISPSVDFLPLIGALRKALGKKKEPRYFLYRVTRLGKVGYEVRPERVPAALQGQPGVEFQLVEGFPDLDAATKAQRRLEQGFESPHSSSAPPTPPWATAQPCRPN